MALGGRLVEGPSDGCHRALPKPWKVVISTVMESKFKCIGARVFVLQDHYRLPARFFASVFGAVSSRLR
jgi:hypothetical protein